jgi:hypothetical protein
MELQPGKFQRRQRRRGFASGRCPSVGDEDCSAADSSLDMVNGGRDCRRGISTLRCARPSPPTCNAHRQVHPSRNSLLLSACTSQSCTFGRVRRSMSERSILSSAALLVLNALALPSCGPQFGAHLFAPTGKKPETDRLSHAFSTASALVLRCLRGIFSRQRVVALEHLVVTPPRTSEQIARAIQGARVAEMCKQDAAG